MTYRQAFLRARAGLFLHGPMPTYRQLMHALHIGKCAAVMWHWKIAKARKEFT